MLEGKGKKEGWTLPIRRAEAIAQIMPEFVPEQGISEERLKRLGELIRRFSQGGKEMDTLTSKVLTIVTSMGNIRALKFLVDIPLPPTPFPGVTLNILWSGANSLESAVGRRRYGEKGGETDDDLRYLKRLLTYSEPPFPLTAFPIRKAAAVLLGASGNPTAQGVLLELAQDRELDQDLRKVLWRILLPPLPLQGEVDDAKPGSINFVDSPWGPLPTNVTKIGALLQEGDGVTRTCIIDYLKFCRSNETCKLLIEYLGSDDAVAVEAALMCHFTLAKKHLLDLLTAGHAEEPVMQAANRIIDYVTEMQTHFFGVTE